MENYFPDEMLDFSLSELEQDVLGYYYLKSYEGRNISLSQYNKNSYKIVNAIRSLIDKNLITSVPPKMNLCITPFGKAVAEIIDKESIDEFDLKELDFNDVFDIYFKFYDGQNFYGLCEPDITRYIYSILVNDKSKINTANILKSGERYIISDSDKITQSGGRHSNPECICDYVTLKIPRKGKSSNEVQSFLCNVSLNKIFDIFPRDYFEIEEIESDDPIYLKMKQSYLEKKKYYDENKNSLQMIQSLTNNGIDAIKEPTFDFVVYRYLVPIGDGKLLGEKIKDYSGFKIPYRPH